MDIGQIKILKDLSHHDPQEHYYYIDTELFGCDIFIKGSEGYESLQRVRNSGDNSSSKISEGGLLIIDVYKINGSKLKEMSSDSLRIRRLVSNAIDELRAKKEFVEFVLQIREDKESEISDIEK